MSKKLFIQSYGCAMNFSDSEIVASILKKEGYTLCDQIENSDLVLINTCSIREKAEDTVRKRLETVNVHKKNKPSIVVGILGCMAERLKDKLLNEEKIVDIVAGPDAYRDLPNLVKNVIYKNEKSINTILSLEETYENIKPVRINSNGITAFISIMRGCDNMCSFCVVPYTRGRERSRDPESILKECQELFAQGYREITLLGQNVDSYLWYGGGAKKNFRKASEINKKNSVTFAMLLEKVALINKKLRIRFSTSNPQDMTKDVILTMKKYSNICKYIHLPVQSGSSKILKKMNRGYNRDEYFQLIKYIKKTIPDCAISMDMIVGFCGEKEEDHKETLSLMDFVKYDYGYMFKYSVRPNTAAAKMKDDVDEATKQKRLEEVINKQRAHSLLHMQEKVGNTYEVLIEGVSKKSKQHYYGRTTYNSAVVFEKKNYMIGDYVMVKINSCTSATLIGTVI